MAQNARRRPVVTDGASKRVRLESSNSENTSTSSRKKQRKPRRGPPLNVRWAEVRTAFNYLYRGRFPDTETGRRHLLVALEVRAPKGEGEPTLRRYMKSVAPWLDEATTQTLLDRAYAREFGYSHDELGLIIGLPGDVVDSLGITTFGGVGLTSQDRLKRRNARKVAKRRAKRRAAGARARSNSYSRTRPWEHFGIQRRAWEKRGKPIPPGDANMTPSNLTYVLGDKFASCSAEQGGGAQGRAEGPRYARKPRRESGARFEEGFDSMKEGRTAA
jgi:hypothetical protein